MATKATTSSNRKERGKFQHDGVPSVFTCPDCSGTLFLLKTGRLVRYRCRIGHLYSPESMLQAQADNVERSLWTAVRALEEHAEYNRQLADQISNGRDGKIYLDRSRTALASADTVRKVMEDNLKKAV